MKSAVSEKGQVTIPKAIRDRLGLTPGTQLEFRAENGKLVGVKSVREDVFRKWRGRGRLPGNLSVDKYLRMTRGPDAHGR
ncbi:MAG: AbrB/MazE/SpoVT family DNA-binding domain-containing protein [Deltaproteobacteria bacterium]|nr:AbrB/MazE/SpoVT family DNA-binding domain-containing protein [Deltaproteobacteria bacterium]